MTKLRYQDRQHFERLDVLCRALPLDHIRWNPTRRKFYVGLRGQASKFLYVGAGSTLIDAFENALASVETLLDALEK